MNFSNSPFCTRPGTNGFGERPSPRHQTAPRLGRWKHYDIGPVAGLLHVGAAPAPRFRVGRAGVRFAEKPAPTGAANRTSSTEKLAVRAKPRKSECVRIRLAVDQQQVGLDVAFTVARPVAA